MDEYDVRQFVGIDLHRQRSVIVRQSESGDQLSAVRIVNDPVALRLELERAGTDPEVVLEATYGWYWAVDVLQARGAHVHLAHPLGVKGFRYRRVKNDVRDAGDLADLLRMGRLPEAGIAPPQTRELRELVRYRAKLVAIRSGLKAQVHAVLAKAGVLIAASDLFGVGGRQRLAKVPLGAAYAERVRSLLELIDVLDGHEARFAGLIAKRLCNHRGYQALQQVPGIGPVLAAVFVAEIGDVHRFTSPAHLCTAATSPNRVPSWCGGPLSKPSSAIPPRRRSRSTAPGSSHAAARTSPRSPRHANCSPWSTTGCATDISARSTVPGRREHPGRNTRAAAALSDPLPGVVANLIGPRVLPPHRSMPTPAGRRDDRQPDPIRPCPNVSAHHTWRRNPHTNTISPS